MAGARLSSLECGEAFSGQRLGRRRKSGEEVSPQGREGHVQRPQVGVGGRVPPEEREGLPLNPEPEREGSRCRVRDHIPGGLGHRGKDLGLHPKQ